MKLAFALSLVGLTACDPTGSCLDVGRPGSDDEPGSCVINTTKSLCQPPLEFSRGSGEVALATCRARGFARYPAVNGQLPTTAEIEAQAKDGKVVTLFRPSAVPAAR